MAKNVAESFALSLNAKTLPWRAYAMLALLCLAFFLPGIALLPPTDRDESLFAEATKQMIETGDYVNINFLGTPRYKKPVGIYWLQAASVRLLNPEHLNEIWAYRVPSLLGATLAVLMTAALGALLFNGMVGLVAGVMMASCLDLNVEAHLAKTDAALLATVMVAQYALARAYLLPQSGCKNAFVFWSALGVGILLKGPIILLTLFSTLLWLRFSEKTLAWFMRLKPLVGIPYCIALIAPWFIAINLASHGQFAEASAGHDFLAKIWQGQDRGFLPPGLHALIFPAMFFPFSLFALLAIPGAWHARREQSVRFCVGWIIPTWIVFELSLTKLPHYVLPAYPAIAILTAKFFIDGFPTITNSVKRWWPATAVSIWLFVGMALAIGSSLLPVIVDHTFYPLQMVASGILLIAQGVGLLLFLRQKKTQSIAVLSGGMLIFAGVLIAATLPGLHKLWIGREIYEQARIIAPCPHLSVVSAGYAEPSLAFLAGSDTKLEPNGTFAAAEMQHDPCRVGVIGKQLLHGFLESSSDFATQPVFADKVIKGMSPSMELYFYVMPQTEVPTPVYP